MRKNYFKILQNGSPNPKELLGSMPNVLKSRCQQILSSIVYKIEKCLEKNTHTSATDWTEAPNDFFLLFRIPMSQNMKKHISRKKSSFFDKLLLKMFGMNFFIKIKECLDMFSLWFRFQSF